MATIGNLDLVPEGRRVGGNGASKPRHAQHQQRGRQRAAKGHQRHRQQPQKHPRMQKRRDRTEGSARRDTQKMRVGQRIAGHRLQRSPDKPQTRSDQPGKDHARKADLPDDVRAPRAPVRGYEAG